MESMTETSRVIEPDTLDRVVCLSHNWTGAARKEPIVQQEMGSEPTPDMNA